MRINYVKALTATNLHTKTRKKQIEKYVEIRNFKKIVGKLKKAY